MEASEDVLGRARSFRLRLAMHYKKADTISLMLIAEAILEERERCALIADRYSDETAQAIAQAIRGERPNVDKPKTAIDASRKSE